MKSKARKNNNKSTSMALSARITKVVISVALIGFLVMAMFYINTDDLLPIKKIRAQGEFINVTEKMILDAISNEVNSGYLKVNVHNIQSKIEQLAWVKIASVRRVWPDSIVVSITEQKASAIWKKDALLNKNGQVFKPKTIIEKNLPALSGPDTLNVSVMKKYINFESKLNKIGLNISEINLDARRAIYLKLSNNIKISLGRKNYIKRLSRFIKAYKVNLKHFQNKIEYVDMRYTNGFSVKWIENTQAAQAKNMLKGPLDV